MVTNRGRADRSRSPASAAQDPLEPRLERCLLLAIVLGALVLRAVRLGALSFAGDEETTTLAAIALLDGFPPKLPGGLSYVRGLPFTAVEAAMAALFGAGEAAMRVVPVLCAAPRIVGAWWLARPLLGARLALVTAALVAVAPLDVELSRIARMYSMFAALDLLFVAAVVHAAIGRRGMAGASLLGIAATATHSLGATHALVPWGAVLTPGGRARERWKLLAVGAAVAAGYLLLERSIAAAYAGAGEALGVEPVTPLAAHVASLVGLLRGSGGWLAGLLALGGLGLSLSVLPRLREPFARLAAAAAALACAAASPVLGVAVWLVVPLVEGISLGAFARRTRALAAGAALATAAWGITAARAGGGSVEAAARFLLGLPAPNWADLALAAPALVLLAGVGALAAPERALRGAPAGWLALLAAVLGPELLTGLVERREALRYHVHVLAPLIVFALLGAETLTRRWVRRPRAALALAALLVAVAVRPDQSLRAVLRVHGPVAEPFAVLDVAPDHRGAAEYLQPRLRAEEWVAAEDVLEQRLLLGRADVWLRRIEDAGPFLRRDPRDGELRDIYTGALPAHDLVGLRALARAAGRRVVWVVTSGETERQPALYRTAETDAALRAWSELAWFVGRDGWTRIYRLEDGEPVPPEASQLKARDGRNGEETPVGRF